MTRPLARPPMSPTIAAVILMVLGGATAAAMHGLVRLVSRDLHSSVVAFYRNLFGLVVFMPVLVQGGHRLHHTCPIGTHVLRGAALIVSATGYISQHERAEKKQRAMHDIAISAPGRASLANSNEDD